MAKRMTIKQQMAAREERMRLAKLKAATITLKKHDVFYSEDKTGDFANTMFFFDGRTSAMHGDIYYHCLTLEGDADWYSLMELNPDTATIRPYNCETDGDFYGACG